MKWESKKHLYDMEQACNRISEFAQGKNFADYNGDIYFQSAVERQFQILGEALNRLEKADPDLAHRIPNTRDIINFRNILVHGYDKVDNEIVWGIVVRYVPELREAFADLLES